MVEPAPPEPDAISAPVASMTALVNPGYEISVAAPDLKRFWCLRAARLTGSGWLNRFLTKSLNRVKCCKILELSLRSVELIDIGL